MIDDAALAELLESWPIQPSSDSPFQFRHLSPSQLKMAERCLAQFQRRYIWGFKEPPAGALMWGSADHAAAEWAFRERLANDKLPPRPQVEERFVADLEARVEDAGGPGEVSWKELSEEKTAAQAFAETKDAGALLVGAYREQVAPGLVPLTIEEPFQVNVPGVPVPVGGYIDLTALARSDTGRTRERLIERKTTARNGLSGEWLLQTRTMQLARPLQSDIQLSVKTKQPKVVAGVHLFDPAPRAYAEAWIRRVVTKIALCLAEYGPGSPDAPETTWPGAVATGHACTWCAWGPKGSGVCAWWRPEAWGPRRLF